MKRTVIIRGLLVTAICAAATATYANENGENILYVGAGSAKKGDPSKSDATPVTLGYLKVSNTTDSVLGFDISGEGTKLDSTWGQSNSITQAISFNLLFGKNLSRTASSRFDAALLLGIRGKTSSCPSSYLGYQCYADAEPDNSYAVNYGAVVSWTYKSLMLGLRVTGESAQALVGVRF